MNPLSDRINNLAVSQTLAMAALARELKAQGKDIISLSLGEPDFNLLNSLKKLQKSYRRKLQYVYSSRRLLRIERSNLQKFKRDNNLDYKPSQIVVSTGN